MIKCRLSNLTDSIRDSFFVDKVLFPTAVARIILYALCLGGVVSLVSALLVPDTMNVAILLALGVWCLALSAALWVERATRHIANKERRKED